MDLQHESLMCVNPSCATLAHDDKASEFLHTSVS